MVSLFFFSEYSVLVFVHSQLSYMLSPLKRNLHLQLDELLHAHRYTQFAVGVKKTKFRACRAGYYMTVEKRLQKTQRTKNMLLQEKNCSSLDGYWISSLLEYNFLCVMHCFQSSFITQLAALPLRVRCLALFSSNLCKITYI